MARVDEQYADGAEFRQELKDMAGRADLAMKLDRSEFGLVTSELQKLIDDLLSKLLALVSNNNDI